MKKIFKRVLSIVLVMALVVSFTSSALYAKSDKEKETYFYNGVEFEVSVKNFVVTIESVNSDTKTKMVIKENGKGYI